MCGTEKASLDKHTVCETIRCSKPIHQQIVIRKYVNLSCVIEPTVSLTYFIYSCGFNHHQCHLFLTEIEAKYPDLHYHTAVGQLSSGKVLLKLSGFRAKVANF